MGIRNKYKAFLMFVLVFSCLNSAHSAIDREYGLKAAYLFSFARFVYWPDDVEIKTFNICVYGDNPFAGNLKRVTKKKIKQKEIKLLVTDSVEDLYACNIVFISKSENDSYVKAIESLPSGILTVSDILGFSESGGMIEFLRVNNKIKFDINLKQSQASGIKYRSQLLEVAERLR